MPLLPDRNTPRWIIFAIDVVISFIALVIAYLVRFEFNPPALELDLAYRFLPIFLLVRIASFLIGKTYAGIIRYTSAQDTQRIFIVITAGSVLFAALNLLRYSLFDGRYFLPFSIIIIEYLITLFSMVVSRIAVKMLYFELKTPAQAYRRAVIFGAGESGMITKRTLDRDSRSGVHVIAFLDDDPKKTGKKLEGCDIYDAAKAGDFFSSGKVDELIIAVPSISRKRKNELVQLALKHQVRVLNIPPVKQWIGGELSARQIRDVRIEDLLGREMIKLDSNAVSQQVGGKRVLVTGAAGSIGSELVRQLLAYNPAQLVLLDQAETPLFELENELQRHTAAPFETVVGDIRQQDRMRRLMDYLKPHIIYHAAAYKHVPLMECNPSEAVLTNVLGTRIIADLADEFGVKTFVLISTDKAVNPTSVMGATKRVAEIYVQAKNSTSATQYITTRFGNVLGSSGSVIPIFKKQIEEGGPVTVTHPEVTRFVMTIPEAVQLVLEAGTMGRGGEIFAFDMGESVKIIDLARNMIRLSGLEPGTDIEIKYTGLRPGEKLYEEVLADSENTLPTHHPKILIAQVKAYTFEEVHREVNELVKLFDEQNNTQLVAKLKSIVPEYISNNSEFSALDSKTA